MSKNRILLYTVMWLVILSLALPVRAADEKKKDDGFSGSFSLGYRGVDINGVESKYKEDFDLEKGPRLFDFSLQFLPSGNLKKYVDRIDMNLSNPFGDPFRSMELSLVKYGTYNFKYSRQQSAYYYRDIQADVDLHSYDFDRIRDNANLKVWLCRYSHFFFNFERITKNGDSTTSLDVSHDEFEFHKPVNEDSKTFTFGLDVVFKDLTIYWEEKIQDYQNENSFALPGFSVGENTANLAELDEMFVNQPYDFRGFTHTGRISARPLDRLLIKAAASFSHQDLRLDYSEKQIGTAYTGTPFNYAYSGNGNFNRKTTLLDLDISYLINDKFALTTAIRKHDLKQDGTFHVYDVDMTETLDYNTEGLEFGLQYQPSHKFALTAGLRAEKREVELSKEGALEREETKRNGVFGNLRVNFGKALGMTADYQYGSYENPFTHISPTDFHRARFTAKTTLKNFTFSASYLYQLSQNDIADTWKAERSQLNLRAGYSGKKLRMSLGYGLIYSKNEGDQQIAFYSPATWSILNEGKTDFWDGSFHLSLGKKLTLGVYANYYMNDGYWAVERLIVRPFVEAQLFGGFSGQLAYRYIEFTENMYGYNNYIANIFEISFGYRW